MFVRIAWGKVKEGAWSEYERRYLDQNPVSEQPQGLQRRTLVRSVDDPDEGISITFWETREDSEAYRSSPQYERHVENMEDVFIGEWWTKTYEIRYDTG